MSTLSITTENGDVVVPGTYKEPGHVMVKLSEFELDRIRQELNYEYYDNDCDGAVLYSRLTDLSLNLAEHTLAH